MQLLFEGFCAGFYAVGLLKCWATKRVEYGAAELDYAADVAGP